MGTDKNKKQKILNLEYPVIALSPMDGITDSPFRQITKKYGNPDLIFTEFTHVMGLCMAAENTINHFYYEEMERPIIAQIYGQEPEYFYQATKIVCALGFDGVDINMGCPSKKVTSSGSGAALIKTPDLAKEIIYQVKKAVLDWSQNPKLTGLRPKAERAVLNLHNKFVERAIEYEKTNEKKQSNSIGFQNLINHKKQEISVSVKTRIGFDDPITEKWITNLNETELDFISIHGRTLKQMYSGKADWDQLKIAVELANCPVLTNGDIKEYGDIGKMLKHTKAAGVLIGRGSFGNPWIFKENSRTIHEQENISKLGEVMLEHAELFVKLNPDPRAFVQMRKHFGWYTRNFPNAKELRMKLVRANSVEEVKDLTPNPSPGMPGEGGRNSTLESLEGG